MMMQVPAVQYALAPSQPQVVQQGGFTMVQQGGFTMVQGAGSVGASQVLAQAPQVFAQAPQVHAQAPQVAARAPMGYAAPAPVGKEYGYWHEAGAAFQLQQPQVIPAGPQCPLSPNAMAKLKQFTTDHHWRQRAKELVPLFSDAGNGARGLNYQQLQKFYGTAGQQFFGESLAHLLNPDIFERFDFTGDGVLEFVQAFKSLKCELYTIFHDFGGETIKPIEFKTPQQKGYTMIKELARGGQGAAILADSVEYGKVVLKTYEKSNPNSGTIEEHIAEMEVLKELQKESFVMHAYDIFQDANCVYCVNELMEGGDLEGLREKAGNARIPLTQEYFQNIFKQTLLGLDHIHEHGLMHCDLKEPNVMIKTKDLRDPTVAIIDFGLAQVCAGPGMAGGTPGYIPPETNARHIWYPKGDIFALGVAFFQLLADKTPNEKLGKFGVFQEGFRTMDDIVMFTQTRPLPLHLISSKFPGAMSWLPSMCSKDKKPRPRALQLLENPFFKGECNEPVRNGGAVPANPAAQFAGGQVYASPATKIVSGTTAAGALVSSPYTQSTMSPGSMGNMSLGSISMRQTPALLAPQSTGVLNGSQSPRVLNFGIAQSPQMVYQPAIQVAAGSYLR